MNQDSYNALVAQITATITVPSKTVCFTGHRPQHLFGYVESDARNVNLFWHLRATIEAHIRTGTTHFISGMALGVDLWAVRLLLSLKRHYPHIHIEAAVPCIEHYGVWSPETIEEYVKIEALCDKVTLVTSTRYNARVMHIRNEYMLRNADKCIAVYDNVNKPKGGTGGTVQKAHELGVPTYQLNPSTLTFGELVHT